MIYLTLFLVSLLSGLLVFLRKESVRSLIPVFLSFSGAYLLGICFLHLLPELFENASESIGIYLLIGFFLQLILDYFSGGIEHGHTHLNKDKVGTFPYVVFLSLSLHAFLEAVPLEDITNNGISSYFYGILIHKAPISFVLISLLIAYGLKKRLIIISLIIFSALGPAGVFLGSQFSFSSAIFQNLFALSVGIILHLATTILIETNDQHLIEWKKLYPLLLGVLFALLSIIVH